MATKTISLEMDAYERLKRAKREGESFSAVVRRARFGPTLSTGSAILDLLRTLKPSEEDRKAAEYWEAQKNEESSRPTCVSPSHWEA